jgi:CRISPR-associated protein (TIGR03984 family)
VTDLNRMTELRWRAADQVTLAGALAAAVRVLADDAIGLMSTTAWHGFVRLDGADLRTPNRIVNLAEVFEARIFDGTVELRWLNEHDGAGRAVLLADDPSALTAAAPPFEKEQCEPVSDVPDDQQLLLWGRPLDPNPDPSGWMTLAEHRIGRMPVPGLGAAPSADGHDPVLWLREYITTDNYGNAYVLDERLCRPAWAPVRRKETTS